MSIVWWLALAYGLVAGPWILLWLAPVAGIVYLYMVAGLVYGLGAGLLFLLWLVHALGIVFWPDDGILHKDPPPYPYSLCSEFNSLQHRGGASWSNLHGSGAIGRFNLGFSECV